MGPVLQFYLVTGRKTRAIVARRQDCRNNTSIAVSTALPFKTLNVHWKDIVENQRLDEAVGRISSEKIARRPYFIKSQYICK